MTLCINEENFYIKYKLKQIIRVIFGRIFIVRS